MGEAMVKRAGSEIGGKVTVMASANEPALVHHEQRKMLAFLPRKRLKKMRTLVNIKRTQKSTMKRIAADRDIQKHGAETGAP